MTLDNALFNRERHFASAEKLALLSFLTREFDLNQFLPLAGSNLEIISSFVSQEINRHKRKTDLIYCDLSGRSEFDPFLVVIFFELLSKKGIVCIDGLDCPDELTRTFHEKLYLVLQVPGFSIFARSDGPQAASSIVNQIDLFRRKYFFGNESKGRSLMSEYLPLVTVIVLTYKHEQYIAECLNSVLTQQGNFRMRVIIIDDASSDQTPQVVREIIAGRCNDNLEIEFYANSDNCGVVKNLSTAIRLAAGCDYLTFCEGDDFWTSKTRTQEHLDFLADHPECVMSFNTIELCDADGTSRRIYKEQVAQPLNVMDGNNLAVLNIIGNFTACLYDGTLTKILPGKLFDMYTVDWMFNLYISQFGKIGHVRKPLSVYRQHDGGEWSNRLEWDKAVALSKLSNEYNKFLGFQYNEGFQKYKKMLLGWMFHNHSDKADKFDLIIMDDVFPSQISGFRYAEFTAYLREFPSAIVLASGTTLPFLGEEQLNSLIHKYQLRYPELGNQVMESAGTFPVQLGKLLYVNFLTNAYALLPIAEEAKVPFVFTLYPGGGFGLGNPECDLKLKRIFDSPCFRKVIVTQQITFDYLTNNQLCQADKIALIFGVVMPQDLFNAPIMKDKARWGFGKKQLDICFMAHRYTPHGEDKGYDVFINAACRLRELYDDIYFHVVGPYDKSVIDINPICGRIEFHGTLTPDQLDDFFKNMDIIMSPNVSGKIWPGSFDGFPTASCTDGGLRGTAIFCTDEFNSAAGRFVNDQDFVLIDYDIGHIIKKVEYYYSNPLELKNIGENGSKRILDIYSYEAQLGPRVQILRDLVDSPFVFDCEKWRSLKSCSVESAASPLNVVSSRVPSPAWTCLRKYSPEIFKILYRKCIKRYIGLKFVFW